MRKLLLSTIASSLLFTTITVADTNGTMLTSKQVSQKATQDETARVEHNQVKLVQEAIKSLELSAKALKSLNENNPKEAKKNIELALGKLEAILSAEKTPKLLPIENRILVKNFAGTAKDVDTALEQVKKLLGDGKVQQARVLLSNSKVKLMLQL